jgi:hypothetical protein
MEQLATIVARGPELATDGVTRWRRIDPKRVIEERFGVVYSERAVASALPISGRFSSGSSR